MLAWPLIAFVIFVLSSRERYPNNANINNSNSNVDPYNIIREKIPHIFEIFKALTGAFTMGIADAFYIVKTFLLSLVVIFSGVVINQYNNISDEDLSKKYGSSHFKEIFESFISFLMITVFLSLFNSSNVPRILTFVIEYLTPIAVIFLVCYLIYYTNHMSLLSKKQMIADLPEIKADSTVVDIPEPPKIITSNIMFDGVKHPI
jgi:hypothetical protein